MPGNNECAVFTLIHILSLLSPNHLPTVFLPTPYHLSAVSLPSLHHLFIWSAVSLNSNLVVTAVAEPIVKSKDPLRLVRHATAILRIRNTVGLVRRIAQVEIGRPDIAVYHTHSVSNNSPLLTSYAIHSNSSEHQANQTHRRLCAQSHHCHRCPRA
jgi:hypothetical protein